jgi:hypothetical protein
MKKHFEYLRYLLRHKWFVLLAGLKTGAPLWRLLIHDWSKFLPSEWFAYANWFYDPRRDTKVDEFKAAFDQAWLAHQHRNPHHWQHWLLQKDDGTKKALPMPDHFVAEMVADWAGAGRAIAGSWDIGPWYRDSRDRMQLHMDTRDFVDRILRTVFKVDSQLDRRLTINGNAVRSPDVVKTYEELCALAGYAPGRMPSMIVRHRASKLHQSLCKGQSIELKDDMVFDIIDTSSA